jgi:pSer/pThr/pTyr-binding forkhead associated (FHA) protein
LVISNKSADIMPPRRATRRAAATKATKKISEDSKSSSVRALTLECVAGPCAGQRFEVKSDRETGVGRTKRGNAVWIKGDAAVSQSHAVVRWDEDRERWRIVDVGSSNGTNVDGAEVEADGDGATLREGSVVKLGTETTLVVRLMDGKEEEEDVIGEKNDDEASVDEKENEDANGGKDRDAYAFDLTSPDVAAKKPAAKPVEASRKRAKTTAPVDNASKKPKAPAKPNAETRETAPPAVDVPTVYDYARVQLERVVQSMTADALGLQRELETEAKTIIDAILRDAALAATET